MAGVVRPRDFGTDQQHSADGAGDPHTGDGHSRSATSRVYVVDTRHSGVHDADTDRAEKCWLPHFPHTD